MKNKKTIILCVALVVILAVASFAYNNLSLNQQSELSLTKEDKTMLPDFTLIDMQGNEVSVKDLLGKPTIINFWATWCSYCMEEMPDFQKAYEKYGDKVNFIMIDAVDGYRETVDIGKEYVQKQGYTFPVYFDTDSKAVEACGVTGFPNTFFVSDTGEILLKYPSYITGDRLMQMVASMAGETEENTQN